jgi:flagellar biosynthesis protein FlhF
MQIKSFFGSNVRAAMARAEAEWGTEAMLISSRAASPESGHAGQIEVVCALDAGKTNGSGIPPSAIAPPARPANSQHASEFAAIREQVDSIRVALSRLSLPGPTWLPRSSALARYFSRLIDIETDRDIALDVIEKVFNRLAANGNTENAYDDGTVGRSVVAELAARLSPPPAKTEPMPRILALVGPPGAGKTTTLVKLAVSEGLQKQKTIQIICLDTYRVAAADQLRSYAAILGVPFELVDHASLLEGAVRASQGKDLVLIDTPGIGPAEAEILADFASGMQSLETLQVHLVLPACLRIADLQRTAARFATVRPTHLLFTRTDETDSFGPLYSLSVLANRPVSYLCSGQQVPEDIEPATPETVCSLLVKEEAAERSLACA